MQRIVLPDSRCREITTANPRFDSEAARRRLAVIPWQMALVALALRLVPGWLYDRMAARAPRKPRDLPL